MKKASLAINGGAVTVDEMFGQLENGSNFAGKVTAQIQEVCTKKGCWLTLSLSDGNLKKERCFDPSKI